MNSETPPTRRPIAAVRISTVALLGVVAAVAVPAGAAAIVLSGSVGGKVLPQGLSEADTVNRVVVVDSDGAVRITGDPGVRGMTGHASLTWHTFRNGGTPKVIQQYADGVLTLTKNCGGTDCGADLDILVPPNASVQVTTSNAGVYVTNVAGGVDLHTSNAAISAKQLGSGEATMNTSNDWIEASFVGAAQSIWAHTSNGHVTIVTDGRTPYYDKTSTSNGQTHTDNNPNRYSPNTVDALTSNGDITIR